MARKIEIEVVSKTKEFGKGIQESKKHLGGLGKAAGVAGLAIAGGLAVGLEKSVNAAVSAQASQARLAQAFKAAHIAIGPYTAALDKAESSGRKLGFTDEDTKDSLARLLTATHNYGAAAKELAVAQDIARFKSVSLTDATKMLTMAQTGSQRAAKQLGITVPTVTSAQDALKASVLAQQDALHKGATAADKLKFAHAFLSGTTGKAELAQAKLTDKLKTGQLVIRMTAEHVKGQGKAYADTAAGGMAKFHAQMDHLEVKMGEGLLPVLGKLVGKLSDFADFLSKHTTIAKILAVAVGGLALAMGVLSVASTIAAIDMSAFWIAATAGLVILIPALIAFVYIIIKHWDQIKKVFFDALDKIKGAISTAWNTVKSITETAWNAIKATAQAIWNGIKAAIFFAINAVVFYFKNFTLPGLILSHWNTIKNSTVAAWDFIKGKIVGIVSSVTSWVSDKIGDIAGFFKALPGKIGDAIGGSMHLLKDKLFAIFDPAKIKKWILDALHFGSPSPFFVDIGKQMILSIIHGVGSMAGVLKNAVVNMAESLPKKVGSSLGNLGQGGLAPSDYGPPGTLVPQVLHALSYARSHGWHGSVTSGYRTYAEQAALYKRYLAGGPLAAKPGTSSHEHGQAVDVTDYGTFGRIMASAPANDRLYNKLGAADPVHFSVTGYDKGGWLPKGLSLAMNATGKPERVLGPREPIGGAGVVNYNTFNFPNLVGSEAEMERIVQGSLDNYQRRNGGLAFGGGF